MKFNFSDDVKEELKQFLINKIESGDYKYIDMKKVLIKENLSDSAVEQISVKFKFKANDWYLSSTLFEKTSESFLRAHAHMFSKKNWENISRYNILSPTFIKDNLGNLDLKAIKEKVSNHRSYKKYREELLQIIENYQDLV